MARIEFDFVMTTLQANKLEDIANEIENLSSKNIDGTLQTLSTSWKSQTANEFITKGNKISNQIQSTASDLEKVSRNIKKVARQIYDAEQAAKEIATNRSSR